MRTDIFKAKDGKDIYLTVWDEVNSPKAVVQIIHGMAEYVARYNDFAEFLNEKGYIVLGDDHRAHGLTDKNALGLAGDGDLFEKTVGDELGITAYAKEKYGLPVFILGHSYGSFLLQRYLTENSSDLLGAAICGSALMKGVKVTFGHHLAKKRCKKDKDAAGDIFAKLTFEAYDKKIKEGKNAWLSYNKENVEKYNADELCDFVCSNGFYESLFRGFKSISKRNWEIQNKDLPLLVIAGNDDPVGSYGKSVKKLYKKLRKNGNNVQLKLFSNGRHEILNEYNKSEVYSYIYNFISGC